MDRLRRNSFSRSALRTTPGSQEFGAHTVRLPILLFLSLALLMLSKLGHATVRELRAEAEALVSPALSAALTPLGPLRRFGQQLQASYDNFAELDRLKDENQRMRQWESRARDLELKVAELGRLSRALEQQKIEYKTVRIIASSSGSFMQSALLEAGVEQGVKTGLPAINADGVLGRIVEAGRRTSRLLLLTDINSRVPVLVGAAQVRAILAGDNSPEPRLTFLAPGSTVEDGAEITTSGLGGLFPRGLRVGVVRAAAEGARAQLAAELGQLQFASVLLYDNPGLALAQEMRQVQPEAPPRRRNPTERSNGERAPERAPDANRGPERGARP